MTPVVPPPWQLRGSGVVALYRKDKALLQPWIPSSLADRFAGGPAAMMLVDYETSGVGPYRELLFVPGRFRIGSRKYPVITRIVVSSQESVDSGRANWAIPKEIAKFQVTDLEQGQRWQVRQGERLLCDASVRPRGPRLPITTRLLPKTWTTVAQPRDETFLLTHLESRGRARFASLHVHSSGEGFPDLSQCRRLLVTSISQFRMTFPQPAVVTAPDRSANGDPRADR